MKPLPHPLSPDLRLLTLRDLMWLTGSLAIIVAPHALRAPWWLTLLTLCLYGWRFSCTLSRSPLPARRAPAASPPCAGWRAPAGSAR